MGIHFEKKFIMSTTTYWRLIAIELRILIWLYTHILINTLYTIRKCPNFSFPVMIASVSMTLLRDISYLKPISM